MIMPGSRPWWIAGYRLLLAIFIALALAYTAYQDVLAHESLTEFFSYFTIESNLVGMVVFGWGALARRPVPPLLRGGVVVYLVITGVVYALLLAGLPNQGIEPWANDALHRAAPIVAVLDWLIDAPRPAPRWGRVWWWLAFPLAFLAYTLVHGPFVHWYPYPFLDPRPAGYGPVAIAATGIALGFVLVTVLVRWSANRQVRRTIAEPG